MKTLRRLTVVTASVALAWGLIPLQAVAGKIDNPPRAVLKNNLGRQVGPAPTSGGGRKESGEFCGAWISDGFVEWPKALDHKRHRKLHLRFRKDRKPTELTIDEDGGPDIAYNLKPIKTASGDITGWDARFRRPALGHHRLWVDVFWQGNHECHYDEASYMFHVKTIK